MLGERVTDVLGARVADALGAWFGTPRSPWALWSSADAISVPSVVAPAARARADTDALVVQLFAEQASPALFARELEQVRAVLGAPGPRRAADR